MSNGSMRRVSGLARKTIVYDSTKDPYAVQEEPTPCVVCKEPALANSNGMCNLCWSLDYTIRQNFERCSKLISLIQRHR